MKLLSFLVTSLFLCVLDDWLFSISITLEFSESAVIEGVCWSSGSSQQLGDITINGFGVPSLIGWVVWLVAKGFGTEILPDSLIVGLPFLFLLVNLSSSRLSFLALMLKIDELKSVRHTCSSSSVLSLVQDFSACRADLCSPFFVNKKYSNWCTNIY